MNTKLKGEILDILNNICYWDTCPQEYKDRIVIINAQLNEHVNLCDQRVIEELEDLELKFDIYLNNKGDRPNEIGTKEFNYAWELANDYSKNRIQEIKQD